MRIVVGMLGSLGVAAISLALADPPSSPASTSAAAPPAASTPAATPPAQPAATLSLLEKDLLAQGYKMEMRHGERVFCRYEEVVGSRLGGQKFCAPADQIRAKQQAAKESVDTIQQRTHTPTGN